ncbi:tetratricopeptide repeat protein [Aquisalimonas asiatica]|uniref:Tetratricopeptide repeat-containing protein n=1 Tax=Aquisalimonas asiatica TaxID=406100 RepID=A0A1H8QGC3_9GAMM|nr:tetratricopeptide repeat protein [Aquisalimonas asiatica]SEO53086.1 Tetratricopeptide repeat-containing protein [Aquisalimonas asiatica]
MDRTVTQGCRGGVAAIVLVLTATGCAVVGGDDRREILRLNHEALEAEMEGDDAAAREAYRALLELDPERPRAWFQLGNIEAGKGELDQAVAAYEKALNLDPDYQEARYNLGLVYFRKGAETLEAARDAMPEDSHSHSTDVYLSCLLARVVRNPDIDVPCPDLP